MKATNNPIFITGYLILFLILSGCTEMPESPLRIGTNVWLGYEPLYLARDLGHYHETQVKLIEMTSSTEVMQAIRNGTLEGAALTLDEVLTLLDDKLDLRVILIMDFSHGGDVLMAKPYIKNIRQLKGKYIAVETTAVGAIMLDGALATAGMSLADIHITPCLIDEQILCYATVDAVVTFEPVRTQLLDMGAHQLFDSSQIPGRIIDVLVVTTDTMHTRPKVLKQLLSGYFKARKYLDDHPIAAAKRISARQKITPEQVLIAFKGLKLPSLHENKNLLQGDESPLQITSTELSHFMFNKNMLKHIPKLQALMNSQFLP